MTDFRFTPTVASRGDDPVGFGIIEVSSLTEGVASMVSQTRLLRISY